MIKASGKAYSKQELEEAVQHAITRRDIKEIKDSLGGFERRFDELNNNIVDGYVPRAEWATTLKNFEEKIAKFVTKEEFSPVKNLAYGAAGIILTAVMLAIVGIAIMNGQ